LTRSHRFSPERRLARALLLAGVVLSAAPAGAQPGAEEIGARAREILADPGYQRELPAGSRAAEPRRREGRDSRLRLESEGGNAGVVLPVLGAGALLARIVFLVLLAVAVTLFVVWLARQVIGRSRRAPAARDGGREGAAPAEAPEWEPSFDDAGRLAAAGRYAEAVHALLLAAIRRFAERSRTPIQPSRTSRELIRLLPLGGEAREAFAELVATVELSLFGGQPVGREEYERNLARFRALTRRPA
jgi:hypothetical protein